MLIGMRRQNFPGSQQRELEISTAQTGRMQSTSSPTEEVNVLLPTSRPACLLQARNQTLPSRVCNRCVENTWGKTGRCSTTECLAPHGQPSSPLNCRYWYGNLGTRYSSK